MFLILKFEIYYFSNDKCFNKTYSQEKYDLGKFLNIGLSATFLTNGFNYETCL